MINDNKYVGFEKAGTPVIKSVGANNVDVYINENGEYEAEAPFTGFGKVVVNVPNRPDEAPSGWIPRDVVNGKLEKATRQINFQGINDIGERALQYSYYGVVFPENTTIDMSSITQITGYYACYYVFYKSEGIKTVDLSNLKTIGNYGCYYMFYNSKDIEDIDLSSLESIEDSGCRYMFFSCPKIKTVNLSSLKEAGIFSCYEMFDSCLSLESVNLSNLTKIAGNAFAYTFKNTKLTELSFPALNYVSSYISFNNMLQGVTGCTVHFPSNLESVMADWSTVLNGFGGTDTVILFDLPSTESEDENSEL